MYRPRQEEGAMGAIPGARQGSIPGGRSAEEQPGQRRRARLSSAAPECAAAVLAMRRIVDFRTVACRSNLSKGGTGLSRGGRP